MSSPSLAICAVSSAIRFWSAFAGPAAACAAPRSRPGRLCARPRCPAPGLLSSPSWCPSRPFSGDCGLHRGDRPHVQPGGLSQRAGLLSVVAGDGDHQVVAVDDHFGTGDAEPVDALFNDLFGLVRLIFRRESYRPGAGGQRDQVPPCRSMPSFGSADPPPVKNTSPYTTAGGRERRSTVSTAKPRCEVPAAWPYGEVCSLLFRSPSTAGGVNRTARDRPSVDGRWAGSSWACLQ